MSVQIFEGRIFHARTKPKSHQFKYSTFFVECDLSDLPLKRGIYSVSIKNYLQGESGPAEVLLRKFLKENGISHEFQSAKLQTFPSSLGYVFNPVSFWSLLDSRQQVTAVLCEVNNTFGERHFYWIQNEESVFGAQDYVAEKEFHVSPFFPVQGHYRFRLIEKPRKVIIDYYDEQDQLLLHSYVMGEGQNESPKLWKNIFLKYGWISILVIARIHWQALFLWMKKAQFHTKPELKKNKITFSKSRTAKD